ncbi:hypothetical protein BDV59DRAFT_184709 [Aspergillus ambiguus]|uniref:uncharacterized protein n=1 Tax=Aspergillus ambiguus TaxID=176160 RepID=UPI003CCE1BE9
MYTPSPVGKPWQIVDHTQHPCINFPSFFPVGAAIMLQWANDNRSHSNNPAAWGTPLCSCSVRWSS